MDELLEGLPQRLRYARLLRGIDSCRALDEKAGITYGHTDHIESGRRADVTARIVGKLADALGVSMDWLWAGKGNGPAPIGAGATGTDDS